MTTRTVPAEDLPETTSEDRPVRWMAAAARLRANPPAETFLIAGLVIIALVARFVGRHYESADYTRFLRPWYDTIEAGGGFAALGEKIGDYNVPYLYLMAFLTYLPISPLAAIKLTSIAFDFVLAFVAFKLTRLRYPAGRVPLLIATIVLLLPTVVSNGAIWGQCDSIYASVLLGGIYLLIRERPWWGCALIGLAYSIKQQAIILFPVLLLLLLARRVPWRALLAVPMAYLISVVPAVLLGRDPVELLLTYPRQATARPELTMMAPNVYQFINAGAGRDLVRTLGVLVTGAVVLAVLYALLASRLELTAERIVLVAAGFAVLVPFLLPGMHERYFYLGEVLTVVIASYRPRRLWYVPILVQVASFLSYIPFLFHGVKRREFRPEDVDQRILALLMVAAVVAIGYELIRDVRAHRDSSTAPTATHIPGDLDARPFSHSRRGMSGPTLADD